jgi:hypothetical protein
VAATREEDAGLRSSSSPYFVRARGPKIVEDLLCLQQTRPHAPLRALLLGASCACLREFMMRLPALCVASSAGARLQLRSVRGPKTKTASVPSRRALRVAVSVCCAAASDAEKTYVAAAVDVLRRNGGGSAPVSRLAQALFAVGIKPPAGSGSVGKLLRRFPDLVTVTDTSNPNVKLASASAAGDSDLPRATKSAAGGTNNVDAYVAGVAATLRTFGDSCKTSKLVPALFAVGVAKPAGMKSKAHSVLLSRYPNIFTITPSGRHDQLVTLVSQQLPQPNSQKQKNKRESAKAMAAATNSNNSEKRAAPAKAAPASPAKGTVVATVQQQTAAEPPQPQPLPQPQQQPPQQQREAWRAPPCFAFGIPSPHAGWAPSAGRSRAQVSYSDTLASRTPYVVVVGPAGTGKTYLAVHAGAVALLSGAVQRLVITRPAVPVDEDLGFLPGAIEQKMEPYLVPILDMLSDIWPASAIQILQQERRLQVVPLGFMRGRTFDDAFILADEMQNCTRPQMHTLLTRLGVRSRLVVTGDLRQADADVHTNGLRHVVDRLQAALGDGESTAEEQAAQDGSIAPAVSGEESESEAAPPEALREAVRRDFALVTLDAGSVQRNAAVQTALQLLA